MMTPADADARRIAIIGAGLAGLTCALDLQAAGYAVTVFDKARGPGGRMSSRRTEGGTFDHGAQFFRAWDPGFKAAVAGWIEAGVVAEWTGRIEGIPPTAPFYVGTPRMSALTRYISGDVDTLFTSTRVERVARVADGWHLVDDAGNPLGTWPAVVIATPAEQAVPLLGDAPALAEAAAGIVLAPCWTLMLEFDAPLDAPFDAKTFADGPLGWIARNSSKPGRGSTERWVVQASVPWTRAHLEKSPINIVRWLSDAFAAVVPHPEPVKATAHRWRYARVETALGEPCAWDAAARIGFCGDGCIAARVEAAWLSGKAMAARIG